MMETVSEVTEMAEWMANRLPMLTEMREESSGTLQGVLCTLLTRAVGICHGDGIQSRLPRSRSPKTVPEACLPRVFRRKPDVDASSTSSSSVEEGVLLHRFKRVSHSKNVYPFNHFKVTNNNYDLLPHFPVK